MDEIKMIFANSTYTNKIQRETQRLINASKIVAKTNSEVLVVVGERIISSYLSQLFLPLFTNFDVDSYKLISKMVDNIKLKSIVIVRNYIPILREIILLEIKAVAMMHGVNYALLTEQEKHHIELVVDYICDDFNLLQN